MNILKYFKLFFISISCALFLVACGGGDTPEGVAQDFVTAMTKGDTDKVLTLMDISSEDAAQLEQIRPKLDMAFQQMKKEVDAKGGLKSLEVVKTDISADGNTAKVTLKMTWGNGNSEEMPPMPLKKVDGKWKVSEL